MRFQPPPGAGVYRSSRSINGYPCRRYTWRSAPWLRSDSRIHQAEREKPTFTPFGVPATNPESAGGWLTASMSRVPAGSSSTSTASLSESIRKDWSAASVVTPAVSARTTGEELTKAIAKTRLSSGLLARFRSLYTIAVLCAGCLFEYATVRAGSNAMRRILKWTVRGVAVLVLLGLAAFGWFVWWPVHSIPPLERVDQYVWLDQGWGTAQDDVLRQRYYYTPQGTSMPQGASAGAVRYSWFVNLELPLSRERFADPDHMRRWRFLVDPAPSAANPDQLPIGFTRHFDPRIGEDVLDISCAACHTGEVHFTKDKRTIAMRIDGGPAMHAFTDMQRGNFAPVLLGSLIDTSIKPWKFN